MIRKPPMAGPIAQPAFPPMRSMPNASTRRSWGTMSATIALIPGCITAPRNLIARNASATAMYDARM